MLILINNEIANFVEMCTTIQHNLTQQMLTCFTENNDFFFGFITVTKQFVKILFTEYPVLLKLRRMDRRTGVSSASFGAVMFDFTFF